MNKILPKKIQPVLAKTSIKPTKPIEKMPIVQEKKLPEKPAEIFPAIIKSFTVKEGNNIFEITLTKMANRSFQIKILFNGNEIRPATYTGMSPAMNYWNLLSGSKK